MKKLFSKKPDSWQAYLGLFIKNIGCPVISAAITWYLIWYTDWALWIKIVSIPIVWFFWFYPIITWMSAPLWNSLYIPTPDLPTDKGTATFKSYSLPNSNLIFIRGIVDELLEYNPVDNDNSIKLATRLSSDEEDRLEPKGEIRLRYSFDGYRMKSKRFSYFRNTPQMKYKWPCYSYSILEN